MGSVGCRCSCISFNRDPPDNLLVNPVQLLVLASHVIQGRKSRMPRKNLYLRVVVGIVDKSKHEQSVWEGCRGKDRDAVL